MAAGWAVLSGLLHLYWACGGSAGPASSAGEQLAADRPVVLRRRPVGVAALLLIGGALGLALARARHWPPLLWDPWSLLGGVAHLLAATGLARLSPGGRRWARGPA